MKKKPLISVCMPVFNGQRFLAHTLDSLLAQDYGNFEIVILDNISTDNTKNICLSYAKKDARVRYIIDDIQVGVSDGHNRVAQYARGQYFMVACDDDVYEPDCLSKLFEIIDNNQDIGLVFCEVDLIDENGIRRPSGSSKYCLFFNENNTRYKNVLLYMYKRWPVPLIFGLFRTSLYKQTLPFTHIDSENGERNVDNLFILKILSLARIACSEETLFFYRDRDRGYPPDWPRNEKYSYMIKHQTRLSKAFYDVISNSDFSARQKRRLKMWVILNWFYFFKKITRKKTRSLRHLNFQIQKNEK